jgi:hypothetical protein
MGKLKKADFIPGEGRIEVTRSWEGKERQSKVRKQVKNTVGWEVQGFSSTGG